MVTYNGHPLIIAGGYDYYSGNSGSTSETYQSGTNKNWGKVQNIPITGDYLYDHTAAVVGKKVYTFGGCNGNHVTDRVDYLKSTSGVNLNQSNCSLNHKINRFQPIVKM